MVREFPLDLIVKQGVEYQTRDRQALIIRKLGTDGATDTHLKIDGKDLGNIKSLVAPLRVTETNLLGPLNLGDLYYVVPPEISFEVVGPTNAKMRLIGKMILLDPGVKLGAPYITRFLAQHYHYLTFVEGTYSHGTDVKLVKDAEVEVISLTPKTIEKYTFNNVIMASVTNYTAVGGDLGLRFKIDVEDLEALLAKPLVGGIDILSCPRPPADTTNQVPFSFAPKPIVVLGDRTFRVRIRNISGADISPAAGTSLTFYVTAICEYFKTPE